MNSFRPFWHEYGDAGDDEEQEVDMRASTGDFSATHLVLVYTSTVVLSNTDCELAYRDGMDELG